MRKQERGTGKEADVPANGATLHLKLRISLSLRLSLSLSLSSFRFEFLTPNVFCRIETWECKSAFQVPGFIG
jgi:hypothetical protein